MASEAVERFQHYSGYKALTVHVAPNENPYRAKLEVVSLLQPGTSVIQFDADAFMVCEMDEIYLSSSLFNAVLDPGRFAPENHPMHDCVALGIDSRQYFNSGVMIYGVGDMSRRVFERASSLMEGKSGDCRDFGEQSFLVKAVSEEPGYLNVISDTMNWIPFASAHGFAQKLDGAPVFIHAAGYSCEPCGFHNKTQKEVALATYCNHFESNLPFPKP